MSLYYFLSLALPDLALKIAPELGFKDLEQLCGENLSASDLQKLECLLEPIDLYNMKAFWLGLPLDDRGRIKGKDLEEAMLTSDLLPEYVFDFLDRYESKNERLKNFSSLYVAMYNQDFGGFLGRYFRFERELRLVLLALRVKKYGKDLLKELQFEDMQDPFVMSILAQKDSSDYLPPEDYEEVKVLFLEYYIEPKKLDEALKKFRFDKILELEGIEPFSMDKILGYAARLLILESGQKMNKDKENLEVEELSRYG